MWQTRKAAEWLAATGPGDGPSSLFDGALRPWFAEQVRATVAESMAAEQPLTVQHGSRSMTVRFMDRVGRGEFMLLLEEAAPSITAEALMAAYPVTQREAEVLLWVAQGKTNRDIAEILGMRPRTVNKHREHAFVKLGVETRTAAAALVNRHRA